MNHYNRKSESAAGGPEEAPAFFQWTRRLSTRLALLTALVLAGVIAVLTLLAAEEFSSDAAGERELQAKALAQNIAAVTADGLLAEDYASVEEVLVRSAAFPGVTGIWVSDRRGRVLAHVVRRGDEPPEVRLDPEKLALPPAASDRDQGRPSAGPSIVGGAQAGCVWNTPGEDRRHQAYLDKSLAARVWRSWRARRFVVFTGARQGHPEERPTCRDAGRPARGAIPWMRPDRSRC
jgi:hypothetical protein